MSGPFKSDVTEFLRRLRSDFGFIISAAVFLIPPLLLLTEALFLTRRPLFLVAFFLAGSGAEFLLDLLLRRFYFRGRLTRRRFFFLQYLVRTIIGLPFTIYLALGAATALPGLFRFLPVLVLVDRSRQAGQFAGQVFFFAAGVFLYALLVDVGLPDERGWMVLAAYSGLAGLLSVELQRRHRAGLARAVLRRERHLWRLRHDHVVAREGLLLRSILPEDDVRRRQSDRDVSGESGEFLVLAVNFPGMHQAAEDARVTGGDALAEFQRAWDLQYDHLRRRLEDLGFTTDLDGGGLLRAARRLESGSGDLDVVLFPLVFETLELLHFVARNRRAREGRGRRAWRAEAAVAAGCAVRGSRSSYNPAPSFRGPVIEELERRLLFVPAMNQTAFLADERTTGGAGDRLLVHPDLAVLVRPVLRCRGRRIQPEMVHSPADPSELFDRRRRHRSRTGHPGAHPL